MSELIGFKLLGIPMNVDTLLKYIEENWETTIHRDADGSGFRGFDLPFRYTSPCVKGRGKFYFFFYWDTYFTNLGLLRQGREGVARENIRNVIWAIDRFGYMPNHVGVFNRSQPPFFYKMLSDYLERTHDESILEEAVGALRKEYHFWQLARLGNNGLNHYGHHDTAEGCRNFSRNHRVLSLVGKDERSGVEAERIGATFLAEAESGWDFNPRFLGRCPDFNPVDLNALLFGLESFMINLTEHLPKGEASLWRERQQVRRERADRFLWSQERGFYLDYDFVEESHSPVAALTGVAPLFSGLASQEQATAVAGKLSWFEREHGLAVTEDSDPSRRYQWAYPNMWPPMVWIVVEGLLNYGLRGDAERIARKYIDSCLRLFEKTGQLWEKLDAETGEVAGGEYDAAPMLGWSAGVFVACADLLGKKASVSAWGARGSS